MKIIRKIAQQAAVLKQPPDISHFYEIENFILNKPKGGLWTSTFRNNSTEWVDYVMDEWPVGVKDRNMYMLWPKRKIRLIEIDTLDDFIAMAQMYAIGKLQYDFEAMRRDGYDGMHLTSMGQIETRFTTPGLYGWDVESTIWFNWVF